MVMDDFFPLAVSAEIEDTSHSALCSFQCQHLCWASKQIHGQVVLFFLCPCGLYGTVPVFVTLDYLV